MAHIIDFLKKAVLSSILATVALFFVEPQAHALGVFNLYRFVEPQRFALGVEPELTLTNGAGFGINGRVTYGLGPLNNVQAIAGVGSNVRRMRFGTAFTFDFIPDIEGQPGIGIAAQAVYYRMRARSAPIDQTYGQLDATLLPYVHKNFVTPGGEFEPFVSVPFGLAFNDGTYKSMVNGVIGTMFKGGEKVRYTMELGIAILNADTYVSGGIIFYP